MTTRGQVTKSVRPEIPERPEIEIVLSITDSGEWAFWDQRGRHGFRYPSPGPHDIIRIPSEAEAKYLKDDEKLAAAERRFVNRLLDLEQKIPPPEDYRMQFKSCIEGLRLVRQRRDALDAAHPEFCGKEG